MNDRATIRATPSRMLKYPLWRRDAGMPPNPMTVKMPRYAKIVHVGEQEGVLTLWAAAQPWPEEVRTFHVIGTGENVIAGTEFRGTVQMRNGLVWHVFEEASSSTLDQALADLLLPGEPE